MADHEGRRQQLQWMVDHGELTQTEMDAALASHTTAVTKPQKRTNPLVIVGSLLGGLLLLYIAFGGNRAFQSPTTESTPTTTRAVTTLTARLKNDPAKVQAYANGMQSVSSTLTAKLQAFTTVSSNPQPLSATWRQNMHSASREIREAFGPVARLEPPACLQDAHNAFLVGQDQMIKATILLDTALDTFERGDLNSATTLIEQSTRTMNDSTASMETARLLVKASSCNQ